MDSKLTQNAVVASDYCLMVALPEWLSFVASIETVQHIERIRLDNEQDFNLLGVIFNQVEDSQEHRQTIADANVEFGDRVFKTTIPDYKSFSSRPRVQASYLSLGPRQQAVVEAFADEVIAKIEV
jgi:cellulose biosynthesis protein BcsQ